MNVSGNIKRLRESRGMQQVELAEKCGVTQAMICQIERGTKVPTLPLSKEIADALGCEVNDLIADESVQAAKGGKENVFGK